MLKRSLNRGFTLVEMLVVAPIVILTIGSFIALIVSLTGEVLSSRGSNTLAYNVQDTLNRIESDIKLSTSFLATNNIPFTASNPQGYGANGSRVDFKNISTDNGPMLILNGLVTNGDPTLLSTSTIYLANQPNGCTDPLVYSKNRPLTMNIIYFTDSDGTLWRRTVMPQNYLTAGIRCGTPAPWQQPSCIVGYTSSFCRTNDVKLIEGVGKDGLKIEYFTTAGSTQPITSATSPTNTDAARGTALQSATTASISLTSKNTVAGRAISRTGSLKVTRLDTNATSIATFAPPTVVPAIPVVASNVTEGNKVTFSWPRISTATGYDMDFRIQTNGTWGAWQSGISNGSSNDRTHTVTTAFHGDSLEARVRSKNSVGNSTYATRATTIPLWAFLTTENGWSNYSADWAPATYTKTRSGLVVLRGMVKGGANGSVIGKLPAAYAPGTKMLFPSTSFDLLSRLDVDNDGSIYQRTGNPTWHSLDGIAYLAGNPSGAVALSALQNGWTIHDAANWHAPSYVTDSAGRIHMRGMIRGGTSTSGGALATGTPIVNLPTAARPAAQHMYTPQVTADIFGMVGYNTTTGNLQTRIGPSPNNFFMSMNSMHFPASRATGTTCTTQWCALSLQNGWVNYGSSFTTPQYTRANDGVVHLKGTIRAGSNGTIASLPAGYCPSIKLLMTISTNDTSGRVDIIPQGDGTCSIVAAVYDNTWVSLDGIRFVAEQ